MQASEPNLKAQSLEAEAVLIHDGARAAGLGDHAPVGPAAADPCRDLAVEDHNAPVLFEGMICEHRAVTLDGEGPEGREARRGLLGQRAEDPRSRTQRARGWWWEGYQLDRGVSARRGMVAEKRP